MVVCLGQGADLHMAQLMPLPLTISCSSKSRLILPFWCQLTRVVLDINKRAIKQLCVCVCVCVCACQILDLLIEVFNKGGDAKLDVAVSNDPVPELTRMSPYVAKCFKFTIVMFGATYM